MYLEALDRHLSEKKTHPQPSTSPCPSFVGSVPFDLLQESEDLGAGRNWSLKLHKTVGAHHEIGKSIVYLSNLSIFLSNCLSVGLSIKSIKN